MRSLKIEIYEPGEYKGRRATFTFVGIPSEGELGNLIHDFLHDGPTFSGRKRVTIRIIKRKEEES